MVKSTIPPNTGISDATTLTISTLNLVAPDNVSPPTSFAISIARPVACFNGARAVSRTFTIRSPIILPVCFIAFLTSGSFATSAAVSANFLTLLTEISTISSMVLLLISFPNVASIVQSIYLSAANNPALVTASPVLDIFSIALSPITLPMRVTPCADSCAKLYSAPLMLSGPFVSSSSVLYFNDHPPPLCGKRINSLS